VFSIAVAVLALASGLLFAVMADRVVRGAAFYKTVLCGSFRPTKIAADLGLIDTYPGLVLPLIASATATLLFRQFFLTIPDELVEAAKIDGAGPWRFLIDMVIPLSRTNIAALFVILFIYGWNQYLWPLLVTNTRR